MKQIKSVLTIVILLTFFREGNAQVTVGITGDDVNPDNSALLDIKSSANKGVLFPHVAINDTTQFVLNGNSLKQGMAVYSTSPKTATNSGPGVYYWKGDGWRFTGNSIPAWVYGGNVILPETSPQSLGTTNATGLNVITNNVSRIGIDKDGKIAVNTLPGATQSDYLMATSSTGYLVKSDLIPQNLVTKKVYGNTPGIASGESASVTLSTNPTNSLIIVNTGNGCSRPASATFSATGNSMLSFLGGWSITTRLREVSNTVDSGGASIISVVAVNSATSDYICGDRSTPDMGNFTIRKSGSVITITNNTITIPALKRVYQIVQIIY